MTRPLILALPGNERFADRLRAALDAEVGQIEHRHFPDGESYLRLLSDVTGRDLIIVCTLDRPNPKLAPLLFAADAAHELGARSIGLAAPYLAYMRQDRRFTPGEALTSRSFARLVSSAFDWIATIDPHLHRYAALEEIYGVPCGVGHAAGPIAEWIRDNIERPLLIGPDAESEQWVAEVAAGVGAPFLLCSKQRFGDRNVQVELPDLSGSVGFQPVLVDDVASSGHTLRAAAIGLIDAGWPPPACCIVHALFAEGAHEALWDVASRIVSTDTIAHPSNAIAMAPLLATPIANLIAEVDPRNIARPHRESTD